MSLLKILSTGCVLLLVSSQLEDFDTGVNSPRMYIQQRAGELKNLNLPFKFNHVSQIDIDTAKNNDDGSEAIICRAKDVGLSVKQLDYYYYEGWRFPRDIISDYDDLLRVHTILDMVIWNNRIYLCVASGQIKIFRVDRNNDIESIHLEYKINIQNVSDKQPLEDGNFVYTSDIIAFVSSKMAFAVQNDRVTPLRQYYMSPNFQEAYLSQKHNMLIIAQGADGLSAYSLSNPLVVLQPLNASEIHHFTSIDGHDEEIYVTDRLSGVYKLQIQDGKIALGNLEHKQIDCENLNVDADYFYLSCPEITRVNRKTAEVFKFPNSLFEIRNLAVKDEFLLASGENLVKTYVDNYPISYFQDFQVDKVILSEDRLYIATDIGIQYASWKLSNGNIVCGIPSYDIQYKYLEGKYLTTIHIFAACSQDYMAENNVSLHDLSKYGRCIYHLPLEVDFWEGQPADTFYVKLFGSIFIVSFIIYLMIVFLSRRKIDQINARFNRHLQSLRQKGPGYSNMIEEREVDVLSSVVSKKTSQIEQEQPKNDSYEIGD